MINVDFSTDLHLPNNVDEYNALNVEERIQRLCAEELLSGITEHDVWYHYTSLAILPQLLDEKNKCINMWATDARFVNDSEEIRCGINVINDIFRGKVTIDDLERFYMSKTYIACLSEASDCIPMWNTYAEKGKGIALGFRPFTTSDDITKVIKVIYQGTQQETNWRNKVVRLSNSNNKLDKASLLMNLAYLPFAYKRGGFAYEKEIRIFTIADLEKVDFHVRNGMPVPHVVIPIPLDYLKEIKIGPTANNEKVKLSIELLLKAKGVENVNITFSNQPLQD